MDYTKAPPNNGERIRHFLSTAEDYQQYSDLNPLPSTIAMLGHGEDESTRWAVVMHSMLLRKYYQKSDQLYLVRVIKSLRKCTDDELGWDDFEARVSEFQNKAIVHLRGIDYTDAQLVRGALYGRFLHGDYGGWQLTQHGDSLFDRSLWNTAFDRGNRVLDIAEMIRDGVRQKRVDLDRS